MTLRNQRVLVTGASGFLGGHLIDRLPVTADVHAVSRRRHRFDDRVRWHRADLADPLTPRRLVRRVQPDIVYHLAGSVTAAPSLSLVVPTFASLLGSTVHLLTALAEAGCRRVVLVGSLTEPRAGRAGIVPGSPYVAAKWAASTYGQMFHRLYDVPVVVIRPGMVYGPRQPAEKLVPAVIHAALRGESLPLSSGRLRADWSYVDDVVRGLLAAGNRAGLAGTSIDLGSGRQITVRTLVGELLRQLGKPIVPRWGAVPDRPHEHVRAARLAAARRLLGWEPRVPLTAGLRKTIRWERRIARY